MNDDKFINALKNENNALKEKLLKAQSLTRCYRNWCNDTRSVNLVIEAENIALKKEMEILKYSYETYCKTTKKTLELVQNQLSHIVMMSNKCSDGLPETVVIYDE